MSNLVRTLPEKIRYTLSVLLSKFINGKKKPADLTVKKILVFKEDEIGDLCYTLHVFSMLKAQYPQAHVTLLCKPFAISLTQSNPAIDVTTSNYNDLTGDYEVIIDLRGSWSSFGYTLKHLPQYRLDRATVRLANKRKGKHPHEVLTNLQIISPIIQPEHQHTQPRIYLAEVNKNKAEQFIIDNNLKGFAVLHTGARKALRKWNQFDVLATYLHQKGLDVVFAGDKSDKADILMWQNKLNFTTYSIAGIFNLADFAALVGKARIYIGNESGPLHIAAVSNTPSIGLFGPGEPEVFYPWGAHTKAIHHILPCNPCGQNKCVQQTPCIELITMQEVIKEINALIENI